MVGFGSSNKFLHGNDPNSITGKGDKENAAYLYMEYYSLKKKKKKESLSFA